MIGWDKEKNDFKIQDIFRWDPEKDTYLKVGRSPLLDRIAAQWGYSSEEIDQELRNEKNNPRIHGQKTHTLIRRCLKTST